ncbi:MAG: OB-fold domain-containing protein [Pseudomonadota bacterium]
MSDPRFLGDGPDAVYAAHLAAGRFMIQRCGECRAHIFYPRSLCPKCGAPNPEFVAASGRGTVYSATVQRGFPVRGSDTSLAIVQLEEGPRMMTRIDGIAPDAVAPDMPVVARIVEEEGRHFVVFDHV